MVAFSRYGRGWGSDLSRAMRLLGTGGGDGWRSDAVRLFPLVGAGIGLIGGLAYACAGWIGLQSQLGAVAAVAAMVAITRGWTEQVLLDPHRPGGGLSHGLLLLLFLILARIAAIETLFDPDMVVPALVAAGAVAHAGVAWLGHARGPGDAADEAGGALDSSILIGFALALLLALVLVEPLVALSGVIGGALGIVAAALLWRREQAQRPLLAVATGRHFGETGFLIGVLVALA